MNRRTAGRAAALAACVTLTGLGALGAGSSAHAGALPAATHTVVLHDLRFQPPTVTIKRGESVTWVWRDGSVEHNVTASSFHSHTQTHGTFTVRFTHTGTFRYSCTLHQGMVGRVIVR